MIVTSQLKPARGSNLQPGRAKRLIGFVALSVLSTMLAGCGSGTKVQPTTIAFAQGQMAPPSSVSAGSTTQFAAVVQNDSTNLGVSWLLTCGSPSDVCGSLGRHTASGVPTTFVAPASVPPGGTVTIEANSSSTPSQSVTATITITPAVQGPISVSFSPPPPQTATVDTALALSVVVTNDEIGPNGQPMGATLTLSCAVAGTCGSLIGATYFAPLTVPTSGTVTITATSVADPTKSATATITITLPTVAITMAQTPTGSVAAGAANNFGAFVTDGTLDNASGALGVDWTVTCGGTVCGYFIPPHTDNDSAGSSAQNAQKVTSYTAPTAVPTNGSVTITATATADPTKQVSTTLTVTAATLKNNLLQGQYAFLLNGVHVTGTSALAGSIIADGNGNITGGEETYPGQTPVVSGITGSYFIGTDGRGVMTLNGAPKFGGGGWFNGQQTFAITVIDSSHVFVEEFDGLGPYNIANAPVAAPWYGSTLRGVLELQQTSSFSTPLSGAYVFTWQQAGPTFSLTPCSSFYVCAAYYGGVLNADASGNITSFTMDRYMDGTSGSITSGSYGFQFFGAVDSFGHGLVNIGPYSLHYFEVDSGNVIVMASSSSDQSGLPTGHIYAEPANAAVPAARYVFTSAGSIPMNSGNGANVIGSVPQTAGGWFAVDASGNVSGYLDTNDNGVTFSAAVTGSVGASTVPGRFLLTLIGGGASQFALYPTSNHGLLTLQLDNKRSGVGTVLTQSSPPAPFQGTYAASLQQMSSINTAANTQSVGMPVSTWTDLGGQLIATSSSTLSGTMDIDQLNGLFLGPSGNFWTQMPGQSVTGSFATDSAGRATASVAIPLPNIIQPSSSALIFYVADGTTVLVMESDATPAVGILQVQSF